MRIGLSFANLGPLASAEGAAALGEAGAHVTVAARRADRLAELVA